MLPYFYTLLATKQWNEILQAHSYMEKKQTSIKIYHTYVLCQISVKILSI